MKNDQTVAPDNAASDEQASDKTVPDKNDVTNQTNADKLPSDKLSKEYGGQKGPEPTRYGDWEKNGRCTDF